ncbi:hypothetical protein BOX15_Mlig009844g3, partial [Macrostomum lignano]
LTMSVWKRLQRVGKKAAKFQLTACYHGLTVECGRAYQPHRLVVVWTRRNRRYSTDPAVWTASLANPRQCCVSWEPPENVEITSILYRDPKRAEYESKEWTFVVEDQMANGRRKAIASRPVDLQKLCVSNGEAKQTPLTVKLKPGSKKVTSVTLSLTLHSVLLDKERDAQDEDMVSIASLMSLNDSRRDSGGAGRGGAAAATGAGAGGSSEIANLRDFDDEVDVPSPSDNDASFNRLVERLRGLDADTEATGGAAVTAAADDESPAGTPTNDGHAGKIAGVAAAAEAAFVASPASPSLPSAATTGGHAVPTEVVGSAASQDLLAWAQSVTAGYRNRGVFVNNLTTSFRNGLAFCAIIHHHRPDLLEFAGLKAHDLRENNRRAFEAAHQLGVPRVMDPADMVMKTIPDQLLVMTFLHQLRAHFTNQEIRLVSRLASSESSYTLAQPDEDKDADHSDGNGDNTDHTDEAKKLQTTAKQVDQASGQVVEQQQQQQMPKSKTDSAGLSTATPAALPTSSSAGRGFKELRRERDRDLATRAAKEIRLLSSYNTDGTVRDQVSAGSAVRQSGANFQLKSDAKSAAKSGAASLKKADEERKRGFSGDEEKTVEDAEDEDNDEDAARPSSTVLSNFNRVLDTSAYVASERLALEAEQSDIDSQAEVLEKRLRGVLCGSSGSKDEEQPLLTQWFQLVNKKNALIRRARQLDMLDQEQDLEKRYRMLELELRGVMSVEDWQKTDEERRREDLLLRDLMDIVRKRDEVVREMDLHEREIVKDLDIERKAMERLNRGSGAGSGRTCSVQ